MKYLWWIFLWTASGLAAWAVLMGVRYMYLRGVRKDWMPDPPEDCPDG